MTEQNEDAELPNTANIDQFRSLRSGAAQCFQCPSVSFPTVMLKSGEQQ